MPDDIKIFSEMDLIKTKDGQVIGSEFPAWYHDNMVDELKENIRQDEYQLDKTDMPADRRHTTRERIKKNKERLEQILETTPELDDKQKDYLNKLRKDLGNEISRLMFTRSQMRNGLADAHTEARRMVEPSIKVTGSLYDMAKACNVRIIGDKISRTSAEKVWKICSKRLGEISNTEALRKE